MEVRVHQVSLVVRSREIPLTKSRARQFVIQNWMDDERISRMACGRPVPQAICKVRGKTLGTGLRGWFILIPDKSNGLMWIQPVPHDLPTLDDVPMVIL